MFIRLCPSGKWTFADHREAWNRLCEIRRSGKNRHGVCAIYQCSECGYWHLTSRKKSKAKQQGAKP